MKIETIQTIIAVLAISLTICGAIAIYTHLVGFSARAVLKTREEAIDIVNAFYPGATVVDLKVALDKRTALALFEDGNAGVLYAMGDNWLFHPVTNGDIRDVKLRKSGRLRLIFDDYTAPAINISLEDDAMCKAWRTALQPFYNTASNPVTQGT